MALDRVGTVGIILLVVLTGCLQGGDSEFVLKEDFEESDISGWEIRTYGDNEGEVAVEDGRLLLRVNRCHNAEARVNLGEHDGPLIVEFDWRAEAEQWYEIPGWRVENNSENASYTVVEGTDIQSPGRSNFSEGHVKANVSATRNTTLVYEVHPSKHCSNFDHANTTLTVDNVTVREGD